MLVATHPIDQMSPDSKGRSLLLPFLTSLTSIQSFLAAFLRPLESGTETNVGVHMLDILIAKSHICLPDFISHHLPTYTKSVGLVPTSVSIDHASLCIL